MASQRHLETAENETACKRGSLQRQLKANQRKAPFVQMSMCVPTGRLAYEACVSKRILCCLISNLPL